MLKLVSTDLFDESPRCQVHCGKYQKSGCNACTLRIRTVFTCDNCHTTRIFYGGNAPEICKICKHEFPDLYLLKSDIIQITRINYHLEK